MRNDRYRSLAQGTPVTGQDFIGRKEEVNYILDNLSCDSSLALIGLPRIGKTSLLRHCAAMIKKEATPAFDLVLEYDLSEHEQGIDFFRCLGTELLDELSEISEAGNQRSIRRLHKAIEDHAPAGILFQKLKKCFQSCFSEQFRIAVFIDEFDKVVTFKDKQIFINRIRSLVQIPLPIIFSSRRNLYLLEGNAEVSVLAQTVATRYLRPFTDAELYNCLEYLNITRDQEAILDSLKHKTGGIPWLVMMYLERGAANNDCKQLHVELEYHFFRYYQRIKDIFSSFPGSMSGNNIFQELLQITIGPIWNISPDSIALFLHEYALIRSKETDQEGLVHLYNGFSSHFQLYLNMIERNIPAWELLSVTENLLRGLIQDTTIRKYNQKTNIPWYEECANQYQIRFPKSSKSSKIMQYALEWKTRQQKEMHMTKGEGGSVNLLDYSYIGQLWEIICWEWEDYKSLFLNRREWKQKFDKINGVRNPLAHSRKPSTTMLAEVRACCEELKQLIEHHC